MGCVSKQMVAGKSFEYAILCEFDEKLRRMTDVEVVKNSSYEIARECYGRIGASEQSRYRLSASFAVNFLIDMEPRLACAIDERDRLQLELLSDAQGQSGDVRDILIVRAFQKWEIGVSAKNNHKAVKHSRLSGDIDFGERWLGMKASDLYFDAVRPVFENLRSMKNESGGKALWSGLPDCHKSVYRSVLQAFADELVRLRDANPERAAGNLIRYLLGNRDFYKVIQRKNRVDIYAYNLYGTLNRPVLDKTAKYLSPQPVFPKRIESVAFKENSDTTLIVTLSESWQLSFRIHNASSRIEPSLKFDINLLKSPHSFFQNSLRIGDGGSV